MTVSQKQIDANRRNAQKSTGPKTPEGKRISSMNAVKHGVYAKAIIIESPHLKESKRKYNRLLRKIRDWLNPDEPFQERLTLEVANCVWRANRITRAKNSLILTLCDQMQTSDRSVDAFIAKHHGIGQLIRYEWHLHHQNFLACRIFSYIRELQESDDDQAPKKNQNAKRTHFTAGNTVSQALAGQPNGSPNTASMPVFELCIKTAILALKFSQIAVKRRNIRLQLPKKDVYIASAIKPP